MLPRSSRSPSSQARIIIRSSVWLGVPSLIERVSVTNVTDVLPEAFCVGSAGILNPMQAFLNTLAFHGWTGLDVDLNPQRSRELAWDSGSTSVPNTMGQNPVVGTTLLYQSHIQEVQKDTMGNGQQHSDAISVLSEGNWLASGASSSLVYQGW
ncbi:hypothetical protein XENOCAPTIV_008773 [Xenoophorus captivus]|uniref:Uncharacterized protein n=1 Tax=Xenoophorus captivus TaxID=1517983 RepID=A0ABV0Q8V4_9TELE